MLPVRNHLKEEIILQKNKITIMLFLILILVIKKNNNISDITAHDHKIPTSLPLKPILFQYITEKL